MSKERITKKQYYVMIGSLLKLIREERKLSQQELANIMGLKTYATIMEYERGNIAIPAYQLKILSEELGIDIRELLPKTYSVEKRS